jgi:hypothetical protein
MWPTIRADPQVVVMVTGQSRSDSRGQSADQSGDAEVRFFVFSQVLERLIADTESSVKGKLRKVHHSRPRYRHILPGCC